jgi:hypothetical protein
MTRKQSFFVALLIFVAVVAIVYVIWKPEVIEDVAQLASESLPSSSIPGNPGQVMAGAPGPLPNLAQKPKPSMTLFKNCPPAGDGGDRDLNILKNREDDSPYYPAEFDAVMALTWPRAVERRDRDKWSAQDRAEIERYEGLPIAVEGYLAGARESGPESTNCHGAGKEFKDYHIWLTKNIDEDRSVSIVVEPTPRLFAKHPGWRSNAFRKLVNDKTKVRISGWLMFDPEHPDQVGKTRGTIWEIHPVMQIEAWHEGRWVLLDEWVSLVPIKERNR